MAQKTIHVYSKEIPWKNQAVTVDENKISTSLEIEDVKFSFTDIYVVKANDLP